MITLLFFSICVCDYFPNKTFDLYSYEYLDY